MIPLQLKYFIIINLPFKKEIRIPIRMKRNVPEKWNEMSGKQFKKTIKFLYPEKFGQQLDKTQSQLLVSKVLLNINWLVFFALTTVQKVQLNWLTLFLYQEKNELTKNLLPSFKIPFGKRLYGLGDNFDNLIGSEFIIADNHFFNYFSSGNTADLDKFVACLYRPKRKNYNPHSPDFKGDIREDFNSFLVDARAKKLAKVSLAKKLMAYTYYIGCRTEWEEMYPYVFPKETGEQSLNYGWLEALYKNAGEKFGTLEQTERQPIANILLNMQIQMKDHKEFERKNKTNQKHD